MAVNTQKKEEQSLEDQLFAACYNGNIEKVKLLLRNRNININIQEMIQNNKGPTPLTYACERGHVEIVKLLLNDPRTNVNLGYVGETPFYYACLKGNLEVVKLLLNHKNIDINLTSSNHGFIPLMRACEKGYYEVVELILKSGKITNLNAKTKDGKTAIDIAKENKRTNITKLLELFEENINIAKRNLTYGPQRNYWNLNPQNNIQSNTQMVVNTQKKEEQSLENQLLSASWIGNFEKVKELLQNKNINTNVQGMGPTPLTYACERGHVEIVKLLLSDPRINVNLGYLGETPFYYACLNGKTGVVELLLNHKNVNINLISRNHGFTPLMRACEKGHIEIVKRILKSGKITNLNAKTEDGKTAIDIARETKNKTILELLESFEKRKNKMRKGIFFFLLPFKIIFQSKSFK